MNKSNEINELAAALVAVQSELKNPGFDSENDYYWHKYVSLSALIDHTRPILAKNGLAVVQLVDVGGFVETMLIHKSGQWISQDGGCQPKDPADPQAVGSAITYSRRYGLASILDIAGEADDDANMASGKNQKKDVSESSASSSKVRDWAGKLVSCKEDTLKSGHTIFHIELEDGNVVDTFKQDVAVLAYDMIRANMAVELTAEKNRFGWKIVEMRPKPFPEVTDGKKKEDDLPLLIDDLPF